MNNSNIDKVIAAIKNEARYFNMSIFSTTTLDSEGYLDDFETMTCEDKNWGDTCGTAACICGWANQIRLTKDGRKVKVFTDLGNTDAAAEWLGIDLDVANDLFFVSHTHQNARHGKEKTGLSEGVQIWQSDVTRSHACSVLEHLKRTGKVDWRIGQ